METPTTPPIRPQPPLVILGEARSGTTLLRYLLDTHREICCPGEDRLFETALAVGAFAANAFSYQTDDRNRRPLGSRAEEFVRRMLLEVMDKCARSNGKSIYCSKTAFNRLGDDSWGIDNFDRLFPGVRYVCIARRCLDVVASSIERQKYGAMVYYRRYLRAAPNPLAGWLDYNLVSAVVESWLDKNNKIAAVLEEMQTRAVLVRYEELVTQPGREMRRVLDFLGLRHDDALIHAAFAREHPGNQDPKAITAVGVEDRRGNGKTVPVDFITPEQRVRIAALEARLGFTTDMATNNGGTRLPTALRTLEQLFEHHMVACATANRDMLRQLCVGKRGTIQFTLQGQSPVTWSVEIDQGEVAIHRGERSWRSHVRMPARLLLAIANREIDAGVAWLDHREITCEGEQCFGLLKWLLFSEAAIPEMY